MSTEDFVVCPATAGGWGYIAAALARLFARLRARERHCVIVETSEVHYVQFIVREGGGIWAEAVGDRNLGVECLDEEQRASLAELGWHAPNEERPAGGNYWREWTEAGSDAEAGALMALTCVNTFRADDFCEVHVKTFPAVIDAR